MASAHELVQSCSNLFTLPEIYLRVRDVVDNPESTMDDLANALKFDPAISARLLKIVNSPLYGFPKQIDNIARAVTLLGMQPVSDLVASTTIGQTFTGMTADLMDLPAFWRKSVRCALLARKIAQAIDVEESERFFIEGLYGTSATWCSIKPFRNGHSPLWSKPDISGHRSPKWNNRASDTTSPRSARN